ncbi:MAG: PH domain-containing protein [Planctomycetes bacterium]|nr:PH domain-containing protein [Planctomycetota bacterium]
MENGKTIMEGKPSLPAAMAVASVGFAFFTGVAMAVLLLPEGAPNTAQWVLAGICLALAALMYPWQALDTASRRHVLTDTSVIYRCGVLTRFEAEVLYSRIRSVRVKQGILQRMFGCGTVLLDTGGPASPIAVSEEDRNALALRSIPDYGQVADFVRAKLREMEIHSAASARKVAE